MSRALVTGGTGCIGAVAVRDLLRLGIDEIVVASRGSDKTRLQMWLGGGLDGELYGELEGEIDSRVRFAALDLGDDAAVSTLVADVQPSHVVHLAALQSPDCDRDPALGMRVNVGATQALLEAVERLEQRPQRVVFASSAAVYGPRSHYDTPLVAESAELLPPNRYGVWKVAGEHLCRLFHGRTGIPIVSLRLNTTYGPGRDQGMTSAVTTAMKHVVRGHTAGRPEPFRMPYRGRENYHYVEDVGAHFAIAATAPFTGCAAFNIRGETIEVADFLATIADVAAELEFDHVDLAVAEDARENLFVSDLDDAAVRARFPDAPRTALADGVRRTLQQFVASSG